MAAGGDHSKWLEPPSINDFIVKERRPVTVKLRYVLWTYILIGLTFAVVLTKVDHDRAQDLRNAQKFVVDVHPGIEGTLLTMQKRLDSIQGQVDVNEERLVEFNDMYLDDKYKKKVAPIVKKQRGTRRYPARSSHKK